MQRKRYYDGMSFLDELLGDAKESLHDQDMPRYYNSISLIRDMAEYMKKTPMRTDSFPQVMELVQQVFDPNLNVIYRYRPDQIDLVRKIVIREKNRLDTRSYEVTGYRSRLLKKDINTKIGNIDYSLVNN